jgi:hypothetical protein
MERLCFSRRHGPKKITLEKKAAVSSPMPAENPVHNKQEDTP